MTGRAPTILKRGRRPRGFATLVAIALLILVAAALVALGAAFVADARRTKNEIAAAQLRELLTAGTATAAAELPGEQFPQRSPRPVPLPQLLIDAGAALTLELNPADDGGVAVVNAQVGPNRMAQTLHFARNGEQWKIMSVELNAAPPAQFSTQRASTQRASTEPTSTQPASTQPSDRSTAASQRS